MRILRTRKSALWIAALAALAAAAAGGAVLSASALWTPPAPLATAAEWGRACWRWARESAASAGPATRVLPPTVGLFLLGSLLYGGIHGGIRFARTGRFLRGLPVATSGAPRAVLGSKVSSFDDDIRVRVVEDAGLFAFTGGFLRPSVYVSRGMAAGFSGEELRSVLRHEAAHASRKDPLRGWLADALASALWFLPVAGHLRRRFLTATEEEADDRAARSDEGPLALASALVKAARGQFQAIYVAAPGFGGEISVSERVERLIGRPSRSPRAERRAWASVLARSAGVMAALAVLSLGGLDPAGKEGVRAAQTLPPGPPWMLGHGAGQTMMGRMGMPTRRESIPEMMQKRMKPMMEWMWNRGGAAPRSSEPGAPADGAQPRWRGGRLDAGPAR